MTKRKRTIVFLKSFETMISKMFMGVIGSPIHDVITDAVTLLEEDRPKVLSLKEAASCDACWFETNPNVHIDYWPYNSELNRYVLRDKNMDDDDIVYYGNVKWYIRVLPKYYNVRWRCWDREPSKEEIEAINWEDVDK